MKILPRGQNPTGRRAWKDTLFDVRSHLDRCRRRAHLLCRNLFEPAGLLQHGSELRGHGNVDTSTCHTLTVYIPKGTPPRCAALLAGRNRQFRLSQWRRVNFCKNNQSARAQDAARLADERGIVGDLGEYYVSGAYRGVARTHAGVNRANVNEVKISSVIRQ